MRTVARTSAYGCNLGLCRIRQLIINGTLHCGPDAPSVASGTLKYYSAYMPPSRHDDAFVSDLEAIKLTSELSLHNYTATVFAEGRPSTTRD